MRRIPKHNHISLTNLAYTIDCKRVATLFSDNNRRVAFFMPESLVNQVFTIHRAR